LYAGIEGLVDKSEMFKVVDDQGQILVLRPDLTMPIARLAASRFQDSPRPLKFSYLSSAFQSRNSQSLSLKEKTQAGVELIGAASLESDLEMIILLLKTLQKVGVENPLIDIGHADLINEIFADLKIVEAQKVELRRLLAAKNKIGIKNYLNKIEVNSAAKKILLALPALFGSPFTIIDKLKEMPLSKATKTVLKTLSSLFERLQEFDLLQYITFDPMLISRHGYYTGLIFKGYARGYSNLLASGGRYDNLTKNFGLEEPAVGFALEIENLLDYLNKTENFTIKKEARLLLSYQNKGDFYFAYQLSEQLRQAGFTAEIYNQADQAYLKFQQVSYQLKITSKIDLLGYQGQSASFKRSSPVKSIKQILTKLKEWE
jgi:ATP phosphoribosyltransferase regulatory subunit